jgi:hypothetical protein
MTALPWSLNGCGLSAKLLDAAGREVWYRVYPHQRDWCVVYTDAAGEIEIGTVRNVLDAKAIVEKHWQARGVA